jgi:hypothetical protein
VKHGNEHIQSTHSPYQLGVSKELSKANERASGPLHSHCSASMLPKQLVAVGEAFHNGTPT